MCITFLVAIISQSIDLSTCINLVVCVCVYVVNFFPCHSCKLQKTNLGSVLFYNVGLAKPHVRGLIAVTFTCLNILVVYLTKMFENIFLSFHPSLRHCLIILIKS